MPDEGGPAARSAPQQVARLMDGYLITQLLYVAAGLGLVEAAPVARTPGGASGS